jgi:cytochrome c553
MRPLFLLAASAALAGAFSAHAAGDAAAGAKKVFQCQGCHGIPGWKTAFPEVYHVPKLGGQKPEYLANALKAYKTGERDFPTMRAMVADMSEQDIADIAAYYGANAAAPAAPKK